MSKDATWGQAAHTLTIIGQQNLNAEQVKILHNGGYLAAIAKATRDGLLPALEEFRRMLGLVFTLNVNTELSFIELWHTGRYHYSAYDMERHFNSLHIQELKEYPPVEVELFPADSPDIQEQWNAICVAGFRPAVIREFLSFGIQYPNVQRKFRILCLVGRSDGYLTCLDSNPMNDRHGNAERQLTYVSWDSRNDTTLDKNVVESRVLVVR